MQSRTLSKIDTKLANLENEREKLSQGKLEILRRQLIECIHCNRRSAVRLWTFIQDMWYVRPYSCTGGDYWRNSRTETCHLVCPKCNEENYICNHPQKRKIVKIVDSQGFFTSQLFKEVTKRESR